MQRQKLTINFDLKSRTQATFTYKRGEIDKNGVEVELTNINVANATGQVRIKDPEGNSLEPGIVTVNESKATFTLPTYLTGIWEFEVRIFNDNGTTISSTYSYSVLESLDTDDANLSEHESVWDVWTKNEATRVSNESARTTAESTRVSNENTRISNENKRQASIADIEKRFSSLTTAQQQQAEVADARTDFNGVVHANLKTRLDNDFETLASLIPTDIAFDGYESVTTNDTVSGEVSSAVLSGNTMVNVVRLTSPHTMAENGVQNIYPLKDKMIPTKPSVLYTIVLKITNFTTGTVQASADFSLTLGPSSTGDDFSANISGNGVFVYKFTSRPATETSVQPNFRQAQSSCTNGWNYTINNLIILEGDHTDKPLEFFEGLKSAEVSEVTSHGVNLVDCYTQTLDGSTIMGSNSFIPRAVSNACYYRELDVTKTYRLSFKATRTGGTNTALAWALDENLRNYNGSEYFAIRVLDASYPVGSTESRSYTLSNRKGVCIQGNKAITFAEVTIVEVTGSEPSTYIPYQSSTTSLPSPVTLRSLPNGVADTYDVDTGVLTRRCGEVVLNGSESWRVASGWNGDSSSGFEFSLETIKHVSMTNLYCDKFQAANIVASNGKNVELIYSGSTNSVFVKILNSKLPTPDVAGFKSWLAQNPTTVVYQLAESTTEYIENNGQLRSYDYQTTVTADSIVPVKLNGNIPVNYASTLNTLSTTARELKLENLSLIEQAETLEQQLVVANETNNYQDSLIDVSLLATDELYTLIEPLLPEFAKLETKGGNAMVDAYVAMVIKGLKTIEQVPARYREEVKRVLAELEK